MPLSNFTLQYHNKKFEKNIFIDSKNLWYTFFYNFNRLAFFTLSSFLERGKYGSGLMFADAEIFLILTIVFLLVGFVSIWLVKK